MPLSLYREYSVWRHHCICLWAFVYCVVIEFSILLLVETLIYTCLQYNIGRHSIFYIKDFLYRSIQQHRETRYFWPILRNTETSVYILMLQYRDRIPTCRFCWIYGRFSLHIRYITHRCLFKKTVLLTILNPFLCTSIVTAYQAVSLYILIAHSIEK
jgi:hypothetical protein